MASAMGNLDERVVPKFYFKPLEVLPFPGLDAEQTEFFKSQTGIMDDDELARHITGLRARAFSIYPYPCIRGFSFTKLKISRLFAYKQFLHLGLTREGAIFLDAGCCFGNDVRKAIADGYPADNVVACDLKQEFWDMGLELFKSKLENRQIPFIPGNIFDPSILTVTPPSTSADPPSTPRPNLKELTSLNPLLGHVSAIHASALFHLFPEDEQVHLARALAGLLSPERGSMIFGEHVTRPVTTTQFWGEDAATDSMFCQSPDDWEAMWYRIFGEENVKVKTLLQETPAPGPELVRQDPFFRMSWSVTRM